MPSFLKIIHGTFKSQSRATFIYVEGERDYAPVFAQGADLGERYVTRRSDFGERYANVRRRVARHDTRG